MCTNNEFNIFLLKIQIIQMGCTKSVSPSLIQQALLENIYFFCFNKCYWIFNNRLQTIKVKETEIMYHAQIKQIASGRSKVIKKSTHHGHPMNGRIGI